jgi:hypothetical protein
MNVRTRRVAKGGPSDAVTLAARCQGLLIGGTEYQTELNPNQATVATMTASQFRSLKKSRIITLPFRSGGHTHDT